MYFRPGSANYLKIVLLSSASIFSTTALASAFQLHEQSAALLGEFYAGSATVAEDASTNYYNPAGLVYLSPLEMSLGAVNIETQSRFKGSTTQFFAGTETGSASGSTSRLVPNMHIAKNINEKVAIGFSATTPFGLATDYSETSIARYQATKSEIKTINLGPSVAYRMNDWLAFGIGFDAQYAEFVQNVVVNLTGTDSVVKNKMSSWGYGWHAGAMLEAPTNTRLGLNFRSEMKHNFKGKSREGGDSNTATATATFPWLLDLSAQQAITDKITALTTISYSNWSSIESLTVKGVLLPVGPPQDVTQDLNFKNTWSFFGGLRYQFTDSIMFKVGGGYDQTPTNNTDRGLSLPDENRWIASAGIRWVPNSAKFATIDFGYAHLFPDTASIDKDMSTGVITNTASGKVNGNADLFGLQVSLKAAPMVNAMLGKNTGP